MRAKLVTLVVYPLLGLLLQAIGFGVLWYGAEATFGESPTLATSLGAPIGWLALALAGIGAGVLAARGLFRLFRDFRLWVAVPCSVLCYVPILIVASVSAYTLLIIVAPI